MCEATELGERIEAALGERIEAALEERIEAKLDSGLGRHDQNLVKQVRYPQHIMLGRSCRQNTCTGQYLLVQQGSGSDLFAIIVTGSGTGPGTRLTV